MSAPDTGDVREEVRKRYAEFAVIGRKSVV